MSDPHLSFRSTSQQVAGLGLFAEVPAPSADPKWLVSPESEIEWDFQRFHYRHPDWYAAIEVAALRWSEASPGTRIGIARLVENLRYSKEVVVDGMMFKMNNNHRAMYARLLIARHPKLAKVIETRGRREDRASSDYDTTGRQR